MTDAPETWRRLLLSEDLPADLDALFADSIPEACALAGADADPADMRAGAELAARAYLEVRLHRQRRAPGQREAWQLERVAKAAAELARALEVLPRGRAASIKMRGELRQVMTERPGLGADLAARAHDVHGPGDPMRGLRELSRITAVAAARLVRKDLADEDETSHARHNRLHAVTADERTLWDSGAMQTPERAALEAFCAAFRPCWERNSGHTFTRGSTADGGLTKSHAVDTLHLLGRKLDARLPRSRVVTAVRHLTSGARI
jgi:hypothetical protein